MSDTVEPAVLDSTKSWLHPICTNPKLDDKLLSRPPFRYLFDIIININQNKGIINGLFTDEELHIDFNEKGPASAKVKAEFLNKLISFVNLASADGRVDVSIKSILTGKEPTKTNKLLQAFGKIAQTQQHSPGLIKSVNKASNATSTLRKDVQADTSQVQPAPPALAKPAPPPTAPPKTATSSTPAPLHPRPAENNSAATPTHAHLTQAPVATVANRTAKPQNSANQQQISRSVAQPSSRADSAAGTVSNLDTAAVHSKHALDAAQPSTEKPSAPQPQQLPSSKPPTTHPHTQQQHEKHHAVAPSQPSRSLSPAAPPALPNRTAVDSVTRSASPSNIPQQQQKPASTDVLEKQQPKSASATIEQKPRTALLPPSPAVEKSTAEPLNKPDGKNSPPATQPRLSANASPLLGDRSSQQFDPFIRPATRSGAVTARARPPTRAPVAAPQKPIPRVVGEAAAAADNNDTVVPSNNFIVVERRETASAVPSSKNAVGSIIDDNDDNDENSLYVVKTAPTGSVDGSSNVRESTVINPRDMPSSVPAGHLVDSLKQAKEAFDTASRTAITAKGASTAGDDPESKIGMQIETLWKNVQLLTQKIGQLNSLTDYYEEDFDAMMKEAQACQSTCKTLDERNASIRNEAPVKLQPLREELDSLQRQIDQENSLIENLALENMEMQDSLEACLRDMVA